MPRSTSFQRHLTHVLNGYIPLLLLIFSFTQHLLLGLSVSFFVHLCLKDIFQCLWELKFQRKRKEDHQYHLLLNQEEFISFKGQALSFHNCFQNSQTSHQFLLITCLQILNQEDNQFYLLVIQGDFFCLIVLSLLNLFQVFNPIPQFLLTVFLQIIFLHPTSIQIHLIFIQNFAPIRSHQFFPNLPTLNILLIKKKQKLMSSINQFEEDTMPIKQPSIVSLNHIVNQKSSNKFRFTPKKEECQNYQQEIKNSFKNQLKLIIIKPSSNEPIIDNSENPRHELNSQMATLSRKLQINLTISDQEYIIPNLKSYHEEYETNEFLGEGCIGLVKRATHKLTGNQFAVKIITTTDDEIIRNMINEFKNLVRVNHKNIVKVYKLFINFNDGFQCESQAIILMEFINGKELFEMINELGHYSEDDAKSLFEQLLSAIQYMHQHGICHRDLKPHNILCKEKVLKVTDFNVSKFSDTYKEFGPLCELDRIEMWTYTGTVAFSAPEIFMGGGYTQSVDLWSAGCILYSILSGKLPFNAQQ